MEKSDQPKATLDDLLAELKAQGARKKDLWDRLPMISTFISTVVLGVAGLWFTHSYNQRQAAIVEMQARQDQENKKQQARCWSSPLWRVRSSPRSSPGSIPPGEPRLRPTVSWPAPLQPARRRCPLLSPSRFHRQFRTLHGRSLPLAGRSVAGSTSAITLRPKNAGKRAISISPSRPIRRRWCLHPPQCAIRLGASMSGSACRPSRERFLRFARR